VVEKFKKAKVIHPYHPLFGSNCAIALVHGLLRAKSVRRSSGLFEYGHEEKSVIWYWEFDAEKEHFHQFQTIDYEVGMRYYEENKFAMWKEN